MYAHDLALASILVLALVGCRRDEDAPPSNDAGTTTDDPTDPTAPTEPTTTSGPDTMTSPTTTADTSGTDESSTGDMEECLGPDGCWSCDAKTPEQILNKCTESECEPFPNTPERLPLLEPDGSLPPIP